MDYIFRVAQKITGNVDIYWGYFKDTEFVKADTLAQELYHKTNDRILVEKITLEGKYFDKIVMCEYEVKVNV